MKLDIRRKTPGAGPEQTGARLPIRGLQELAGPAVSANAGKQSVFYTDFDPNSRSWTAPGGIGNSEFQKVRALVGEHVTETQHQIDGLDSSVAETA